MRILLKTDISWPDEFLQRLPRRSKHLVKKYMADAVRVALIRMMSPYGFPDRVHDRPGTGRHNILRKVPRMSRWRSLSGRSHAGRTATFSSTEALHGSVCVKSLNGLLSWDEALERLLAGKELTFRRSPTTKPCSDNVRPYLDGHRLVQGGGCRQRMPAGGDGGKSCGDRRADDERGGGFPGGARGNHSDRAEAIRKHTGTCRSPSPRSPPRHCRPTASRTRSISTKSCRR